jgi:hypothetical protein
MQKTCIAPGFALEADGESSNDGCGSGWFATALRRFEGTTGLGIVEMVEDNDMERGGEYSRGWDSESVYPSLGLTASLENGWEVRPSQVRTGRLSRLLLLWLRVLLHEASYN